MTCELGSKRRPGFSSVKIRTSDVPVQVDQEGTKSFIRTRRKRDKVDMRIFQTRDMGAESSVSFSPMSLHPEAFSMAANTLLRNQVKRKMG